MRTPVGVALLSVCLGLAGCSLFGKKQTAHQSNPKPFMGSGSDAATAPARAAAPATPSGDPPPGANGLLAGRVIKSATGAPAKTVIQVRDLQDGNPKAALDVETKEDGWFIIPSLIPGHHYQLIARAEEGKQLASGIIVTRAPNPHLLIEIDPSFTTPNTPPLPDAPKIPDKKGSTSTPSGQERTPAASLDRPIRINPDTASPSPRDGDPSAPRGSDKGANQGGGNPPNIANVADGFARVPRDPKADIPWRGQGGATPWSTLPPPPQWEGMAEDRHSPSKPPSVHPSGPPVSVHVPTPPTHVPSCVLVGNKLENFALNDLNGRAWEYKRDRQGRLVLLDFWYSTCSNCKHAFPRLSALQRDYGKYGLQVIGIAAETGDFKDQVANVSSVRGRYHINYLTLLSGGGHYQCPVIKQFRVQSYPTLVLLDDSGTIIWSCYDGMDDYAWATLERFIQNKLNIQPR